MHFWLKHSGARVLPNTRPEQNFSTTLTLDSAKNMVVSGQVCMREIFEFDVLEVKLPKTPAGVSVEYNFVDYAIFNDGTPYPDILAKEKTLSVKRHFTQVLWVTFRVDKKARKGEYLLPVTIKYRCRDQESQQTANFNLKIYSTTLPDVQDQKLGHEYFYNPYCYFAYKDTPAPDSVPEYFPKYQRYSDKWWEFYSEMLDAAKEIRINTFYIMALRLLADGGSKRIAEDKWQFNFELFDKVVEFALAKGNFRTISLDATLTCAQNKTIESLDENSEIIKIEYTDSSAEVWAKVFYTEIYNHIKEKGWLDIFYAHLQDEPHQKETWLWARALAKKYMPNVICGEPIDMVTVAEELAGECQIFIPRTDEYEKNPKFFKNRQKKGDQVWCYTCCFPEEGWKLNKFIDQPHLYSRLIHWASFSQGITGFLHWGFSFWFAGVNYGMTPEVRFKGDGYIVYPDIKNNSVMLSARALATRDGIQEYELLNLLSKKDEKSARKISRRVAKGFVNFNKNEDAVDIARREILELLEK